MNLIGNQSRPFVSDRSLCGGCAKNESKAFIGFSALCGSFFVYVEGICIHVLVLSKYYTKEI